MPRRIESRRMERQVVVEKVDTSKFHFEGEVSESSEEEVEERPKTPESATKEYTIVDTLANDKYHLYVEALEKIKEELAPEMDHVCTYGWTIVAWTKEGEVETIGLKESAPCCR